MRAEHPERRTWHQCLCLRQRSAWFITEMHAFAWEFASSTQRVPSSTMRIPTSTMRICSSTMRIWHRRSGLAHRRCGSPHRRCGFPHRRCGFPHRRCGFGIVDLGLLIDDAYFASSIWVSPSESLISHRRYGSADRTDIEAPHRNGVLCGCARLRVFQPRVLDFQLE